MLFIHVMAGWSFGSTSRTYFFPAAMTTILLPHRTLPSSPDSSPFLRLYVMSSFSAPSLYPWNTMFLTWDSTGSQSVHHLTFAASTWEYWRVPITKTISPGVVTSSGDSESGRWLKLHVSALAWCLTCWLLSHVLQVLRCRTIWTTRPRRKLANGIFNTWNRNCQVYHKAQALHTMEP